MVNSKTAKDKLKNKRDPKTFKQSRNWCFTDFKLCDWKLIYHENKDIIRYICFGNEICPSTKKKHIQGFIQFVNKKTRGGVQRLSKTKHFCEPCYGTEAQNVKYCQKENKYFKFGKYKLQGCRTDLEQLKKDLKTENNMLKVADDHFSNFIRYHAGIYKYRQLILKQKTKKFRKIDVELIKGYTGCGKTKSAFERYPNLYKIEGSQLNWFDGYEGEKTLLIDEYNNDVNITRLLNLLDGYQLRLPIKGGFTYANWNKIIITTNLQELHTQAKKEHIEALNRRITKVVNYYDKLPKCAKGNINYAHHDVSLFDLEPESDEEAEP